MVVAYARRWPYRTSKIDELCIHVTNYYRDHVLRRFSLPSTLSGTRLFGGPFPRPPLLLLLPIAVLLSVPDASHGIPYTAALARAHKALDTSAGVHSGPSSFALAAMSVLNARYLMVGGVGSVPRGHVERYWPCLTTRCHEAI